LAFIEEGEAHAKDAKYAKEEMFFFAIFAHLAIFA
jgi:hypothetical protein